MTDCPQTGANIAVSDPGAHERVLNISGGLDTIFKAFSLLCRYERIIFHSVGELHFLQSENRICCRKLWEFVRGLSEPTNPRPLVLRLAVNCTVLLIPPECYTELCSTH